MLKLEGRSLCYLYLLMFEALVRYLPCILGSSPMEQRLTYYLILLLPLINNNSDNGLMGGGRTKVFLESIRILQINQSQIEDILLSMESTHFQTVINTTQEKINSLYQDNSNVLSQPNHQQPSEHSQQHDYEVELDSGPESEEEEQVPGPEAEEEEDKEGSDLEFSEEQLSEEEENIREQLDIQEEENIKMSIEEEELFIDQEELEEIKKKESKAKTERLRMNLRPFQATLIQNSRDRNSIIYLPTGTGKTRISICSMYYYLCKFGTSKKIVFLANTIQLVKQQAEAIKLTLEGIMSNDAFARDLRQKLGSHYIQLDWKTEDLHSQVICIHGEKNQDQTITKRKRIESYMTSRKAFLEEMKKATVTVMISQMFLNCLRRGYIKITDYSFIVFDECHHCRGDHPYSGIMKEFYFEQKKKSKKLEEANRLEDKDRLPIIMGLTASPVSQPFRSYDLLAKELRSLCVNLDSNFAVYRFGEMAADQTDICITEIKQNEERQMIPELISFFDRFKQHSTSYNKIKVHFPKYFLCIKEVIDLMSKRNDCLRVEVQGSSISDPQLYLFYDIKECLLLKLRDLWLQLGEFAFTLGFHDMINELGRLQGLRNAENTILLKEVVEVLRKHFRELNQQFGRCEKRYMSAKVIQLIDILKPSQDDQQNQKVNDMVLVFAFKRRTVKFLQMILQKYRNELQQTEKNFYKSVGVTGYASRQKVYRGQDGHSFQSNPSASQTQIQIAKYHNSFLESQRQFRSNKIQLQKSVLENGQNKTLNNQMARMYFSKMGKVLLEVEEKYSNQIKKILEFKRKEHRVLITTSVTEEGFDIPGCNLVISFDTPFSLKSYIQIKGRARKKNSRYIIFTNDKKSYELMMENRKIYDNTINAIFELAINQIAKETINTDQIEYSPSYKKVATKGGALLNTNYALDLLKSYFTSLKYPNRPYFHFVQTSNICYKCIIKFPQSSTCSQSYIVGKPFSTKLEAMRSASFEAVVMLKKEGFIKDDLRPSRLQELQDELELEKYDDLGLYHKDTSYKEIFDLYVQIEQCEDPSSKKKLVRFYFKSLEPHKLQFPSLNHEFNAKKFQSGQPSTFQIYLIKFSNSISSSLLMEDQGTNEIGILTCFSREETKQIFAGFKQRFQPTSPEMFQLKLIESEVRLTSSEYEQYKRLHVFLLSGEKNNEVDYYNYLNHSPNVQNPNWTYREEKKLTLKIDQTRRYYPLLVLLKRNKNNKFYELDTATNKLIEQHIQLFKKIYTFHNKPARFVYDKPFEETLKTEYQVLQDKIKNNYGKKCMLQSIAKDFCFHKGFLTAKTVKYDKNMQFDEQNKKKGKLRLKYEKLKKIFTHFKDEKDIYHQDIMKLEIWKQASKDDINMLLSKDFKMKIADEGKGSFRFLKEFVLYPITYPTMLRISLASKYVFQVFEDYSIALYFRKFYLKQIFDSLKIKNMHLQNYAYVYYKNVVAENLEKIFTYIQNTGKSKYLRELGKTCLHTLKRYINVIDPTISLSFNESLISAHSSLNDSLNQSALQNSMFPAIGEQPVFSTSAERRKKDVTIDLNLLETLKIDDILRALTSKIYKHQKSQNYEEFEFIGDVVLKFLATIQIFLEKTSAEQGEMHIARANLICNANLHRAAIKKKLFLYGFTTKKKSEPTPIVKVVKGDKNKEEKLRFANTDINILGVNDDDDGYQYIPGKVHADMMEAIIGIFYLKNKRLNDCQTLLYAFGILRKPSLLIEFTFNDAFQPDLPQPYVELEQRLKYKFKHKGLLMQALTHPSFLEYIEDSIDENHSFSRLMSESRANQSKNLSLLSGEISFDNMIKIKKQETFYERLQFLGDAFLDMLVVEYLYDQGGKYINDEGTLSFLKQSAVSNKTLGFIALRLNLHELILMDLDDVDNTLKDFRFLNKSMKGMPSPADFAKLKIGSLKVLGDVFESLIGAVLIDNQFNYEDTKQVIMGVMEPYIRHFTDLSFVEHSPNYKYKEYLDQNNFKKIKLTKVVEEAIIDGEYLYRFSDKAGNLVGKEFRASNDKDAWDKFYESEQPQ